MEASSGALRGLELGSLSLDGYQYAYSVGPNNGPPLVLMHGLSGNQRTWKPVLPYLTDHYQVYAIDQRGHGLSGHPGAYDIGLMTEDAVRFIETVVQEKAFLVGHSMGARIALCLAADRGDLLKALVLEDPPLGFGPAIEGLRDVFEFWLNVCRKGLSESAMAKEILEFNGDGDEDQAAYKAQTLHQLDPEVLELALQKRLWPGTGFEAKFAKVTCPALLMQSDTACGGVMDEDLSTFAELKADNWTWKRFEGVGHSIHYEITEAFCELVASFCKDK